MTHQTLQNILQSGNSSLSAVMQKVKLLAHLNILWRNVIDPALTAHSRVANLRDDCLIIEVDSPAWLMRLRYKTADFLLKLRQYPELTTLRTIDCYIQPVATNNKTTTKLAAAVQPSAAASQILKETADGIEHSQLKNALQKLANSVKKTTV